MSWVSWLRKVSTVGPGWQVIRLHHVVATTVAMPLDIAMQAESINAFDWGTAKWIHKCECAQTMHFGTHSH